MAAWSQPVDRVVRQIEARLHVSNAPLVVAVDGRSGSGKSTFAADLATRLPAVILEGDDFFAGGVGLSGDAPETLAARCIDWRRLRDVISALLREGRAEYLPFDWEAFDNSLAAQSVQIEARPILVLEGVYSGRPELADLVDFAILLQVPEQTRMARLLAREGEIGEWERQWHRAEDWYFAQVVAPQRFDIVLGERDDPSK